MGAKVVAVSSGSKTLKDAINEAMRDWVSNVSTTHYIIGSAIGKFDLISLFLAWYLLIGMCHRSSSVSCDGARVSKRDWEGDSTANA